MILKHEKTLKEKVVDIWFKISAVLWGIAGITLAITIIAFCLKVLIYLYR